MQFHFRLTPIDDIRAWGDSPPTLSWFALTYGWFWIDIGEQELFRYSDAIQEYWQQQHTIPPAILPYEDYQIARYWEDLLELMRSVLDPLPDDFAARLTDIPNWVSWQNKAYAWQKASDDETARNTYDTAVRWWRKRTWHADHLNYPPNIWLWRHDDSVSLQWDNRNICVDGIPVWSAEYGTVSLSIAEFIDAVRTFDTQFLRAMQERIEILRTAPHPEISIDLVALDHSQEYSSGLLENALGEWQREVFRAASWNEIRTAIQSIQRDSAFALLI